MFFSLGFVASDFSILTVKKVSGHVNTCMGGNCSHTDQVYWCHLK